MLKEADKKSEPWTFLPEVVDVPLMTTLVKIPNQRGSSHIIEEKEAQAQKHSMGRPQPTDKEEI